MWNLSRAMDAAPKAVISGLESLLSAIPKSEVITIQDDALFQHLSAGDDRAARIWIAERYLSMEISHQKLTLIRSTIQNPRPAPYDLPAIGDVPVDADHLVPLSAFKYDGSRLLRNGHAFSLLTTTMAPNSSHWLLGALYSQKLDATASVRLDPYLFGLEDQFPAMFYKMWMYGKPLNWERLGRLRQAEHGRWIPGSLSHKSEFTDFCWVPRPDGVHFLGEEVPNVESSVYEPSRYLHAIYDPGSENIGHFDGALRCFTTEEIGHRHRVHVRNGGKLGVREKVFRTDEPIHRDTFSTVAQAFFVWNEDVSRYFTQELVLANSPVS